MDVESRAKELFDLIHLNWDFQKKETKDNFRTLAKHVNRLLIEARIEELDTYRWCGEHPGIEKRIAELKEQLHENN